MNYLLQLCKKYSYELLTAAAILVFFLCKLGDVKIPYFWDEMGVYVPAALQMKDTGHISLLPGSITPLLSRGHPLLFDFSTALVFKIFGDSLTVGHFFALFLGIITLILFYFFGKAIFNRKVACIATVILSVQPVFFTLSVQLVPEMMLAFFTLGCFYGILKHKWILYAVSGSLAMLTKESAIVIPATAVIFLFTEALCEKNLFTWKRFRQLMLCITPFIVFGFFLILQKIQNGWFLFPEHVGYIHWDRESLLQGAGRLFRDIFTSQGRWLVGISFLAGIALSIYPKKTQPGLNRKILGTFALFILLAVVFADINYYLTRYILYVIPFVVLGGTYTVLNILERLFRHLNLIGWLAIILFCGFAVNRGHVNMFVSPDTCDMTYKEIVNISRDAVHWAEKNLQYDTIEANFPISTCIEDPRYGYLTGKPYPYSTNYEKPTKYGLLFFLWEPENIPLGKGLKYHILKTFDEGAAHIVAVEFSRIDSARLRK